MKIILVILIAASVADADYLGETFYGGYRFRYFDNNHDRVNFPGAMMNCFYYPYVAGGYLGIASDYYINRAIAETCYYNEIWIGAGDFGAEGHFEWINGVDLHWTNWESGEPNDSGDEDCVMQNNDDATQWNDESCCKMMGYVCQFPYNTMRRFDSSVLTVYKHEHITTYSEAKEFCKRRATRLVELENREDHQDLFRKLDNNNPIEYWIKGEDEGKCAVATPSGIKLSDCGESLSFICEAVEPNRITVSHEGSVVPEHTDLDIDCTASGYPLPEVAWYLGRDLLPNQTTGNGRSTLHLRDLRVKDSGVYTCHAKNVISGKENDARGFAILDVTSQDADDN